MSETEETLRAPQPAKPESAFLTLGRLIVVWAVALLLSLAVIFLAPVDQRYEWIVVSIGLATLLSFAMQLGTGRKEGFLIRLSFSVVGSVIVIFLAQVIDLVVGAARM